MRKLQTIFDLEEGKQEYTRMELSNLKVSQGFLNEMATRLNLTYLENNLGDDNLCFVNSRELRPEYTTVFIKSDLIHYISSFLKKDCFQMDSDQVPFPNNPTMFWESVEADRR